MNTQNGSEPRRGSGTTAVTECAWSRRLVAVWLLGGLTAVGMSWLNEPSMASTQQVVLPPPLQALYLRCLREMAESRCVLMDGAEATQGRIVASSAVGRVMVAGVGPVDARAHRQLVEAGSGMCEVLRQACRQGASHPVCLTGAAYFQ